MRLLNKLLCGILGHKKIDVIETRQRCKGRKGIRFGKKVYSTSHKGGRKGNIINVTGYYFKCSRCGKKLSKFHSF